MAYNQSPGGSASPFGPQYGGFRSMTWGPANFVDFLRKKAESEQRGGGGGGGGGASVGSPGRTTPGGPAGGGGLGQSEIDLLRQSAADDARRLQQAAMGARDVSAGQYQERGLANSTLAQGAQDVINREEMQGLGELGRGAQDRIMALIERLSRQRGGTGGGAGGGSAGGAIGSYTEQYRRATASGGRGGGGKPTKSPNYGQPGQYFGQQGPGPGGMLSSPYSGPPKEKEEQGGIPGNFGGFIR